MWEYSIYLKPEDIKIANKIVAHLSKNTGEFNTIISLDTKPKEICISVACENIEKPRVVFNISNCLTEIICVDFKARFLEKNLKVKNNNSLSFIALKNALINFDKETDKYIVGKNLEIKTKINLYSFFEFKLIYLKEKWSELVRISNENTEILSSKENVMELLKFLMDNLEINSDVVNLIQNKNKFMIYDNNLDEMKSTVTENLTDEANVIINLINYCPRRLIMYVENDKNELCELVKQIFYNRITILPNKTIINKL